MLERKGWNFGITQGKKRYLMVKIYFWSCDLVKVPIRTFLRKNVLISETISARAKRTQLWYQPKKHVFHGKISFLVMWPWFPGFCGKKVLISETLSARAKRTTFWNHTRIKKYRMENFHFRSCDLEKVQIPTFISETVSATAKRTKFWDRSK